METSPAHDPMKKLSEANAAGDLAAVNNAFYDTLGDRWYQAYDDPVALLRAEGELKNPWIAKRLGEHFSGKAVQILDVGCGAGFLANLLASEGHLVTGVDMSRSSLQVANQRSKGLKDIEPKGMGNRGGRAAYNVADAYRLPFRDASFDAVSALDFLEHVTAPDRVIGEVARVLRPGGLFFFHTFNRNLLAWLVVIKGLEWFVRNTPKRMHVLPLFITPKELESYCLQSGMRVEAITGMRPRLNAPFWKMLATRQVPPNFSFIFTPSLKISYLGCARKSP